MASEGPGSPHYLDSIKQSNGARSQENMEKNQLKKTQEKIMKAEKLYGNTFFSEKGNKININTINKKKYELDDEQVKLMRGLNGLYRLQAQFLGKEVNKHSKTGFCYDISPEMFKKYEIEYDSHGISLNTFNENMKKIKNLICKNMFIKSGKNCIVISDNSIKKIRNMNEKNIEDYIAMINDCIIFLDSAINKIKGKIENDRKKMNNKKFKMEHRYFPHFIEKNKQDGGNNYTINYTNEFMTNYSNNIPLEEFLNIRKNQLKLNEELTEEKKNLLKAMNTLYRLHAKLDHISQKVSKNTKTGFCNSVFIKQNSKNIMCSGTFKKSAKKSIILTNELIQKIYEMDDNDVSNKLIILNDSIKKLNNIKKVQAISGGDKKKKLINKNKAELQKLKNKHKNQIENLKKKQKKELNKLKNM